jgi:hypothetical protein
VLENTPENTAPFLGIPPDRARALRENFVGKKPDALPHRAAAGSEAEGDVLRRLLADQQAATVQARADALALQKSLAEVQERLRTKGHAGVIPARLEDSHARLRPDAVLVRAQWERARKDLQRSQAARSRDAEQAKAKLAEVKDALRLAKEATARERLDSSRQSRSRTLSGMGVFAVVLGLVLFAASYWNPPKWVGGRSSLQAAHHDAPAPPDPEIPQPLSAEMAGNSEVTREISRLTRALARFPGVDPEVVMHAVNKRAPVTASTPCAFEWNHGEPALQFGDRLGARTTVSASLSRCAAAVEQFR